MKRSIFISQLLFFILVFTIITGVNIPVSAEQSTPIDKPSTTVISISDELRIENETLITDQILILNGNLTVADKGALTLSNVTLIVNSTLNNLKSIIIEREGELIADNSTFISYDEYNKINGYDSKFDIPSNGFSFIAYGNLTLDSCYLRGNRGLERYTYNNKTGKGRVLLNGGLEIYSSNSMISNCKLNFSSINCNDSSSIIKNTTFTNTSLIYISNSTTEITGNIFIDSRIDLYNTSGNINGNSISIPGNVGLEVIFSSKITIVNNTFNDCGSAIHAGEATSLRISENRLFNNFIGIYIFESKDNISIDNNTISETRYEGIHVSGSMNIRIVNNVISTCSWGIWTSGFYKYPYETSTLISTNVIKGCSRGISSGNSLNTIRSNTIFNNGIGISLDNSTDMLEDNLFIGPDGEQNIFVDIAQRWCFGLCVKDKHRNEINSHIMVLSENGTIIIDYENSSKISHRFIKDFEILPDGSRIEYNPYTIIVEKGKYRIVEEVEVNKFTEVTIVLDDDSDGFKDRFYGIIKHPIFICAAIIISIIVGIAIRNSIRKRRIEKERR